MFVGRAIQGMLTSVELFEYSLLRISLVPTWRVAGRQAWRGMVVV